MPSIHLTNFISASTDQVYSLSQSISMYEKLCKRLQESFKGVSGSDKLQNGDSFTMSFTVAGRKLIATFRVITSENPKSIVAEQVQGDFTHFRHEQYFKEIENGTILIDKIDFGYPSNFFIKLFTRFSLKKRMNKIFSERINLINQQ